MDRRAQASSLAFVGYHVLKLLKLLNTRGLKEKSASRLSEVGRILHRPGPLQTAKPPCGLVARGAVVCSMAWGAGRCANWGTRKGGHAPAYGFLLSAGWLVGARRRAGSRVLWERSLRGTRICAGDGTGGVSPMGG